MEPRHGATLRADPGAGPGHRRRGLRRVLPLRPPVRAWTRTTRRTGRPTAGRRWPASPATPAGSGWARSSRAATFRRPGLLATVVATVDEMSGGRVELGLGTGWYQREHEAFGIPFPATGRSGSTGWPSSWRSSPGCGGPSPGASSGSASPASTTASTANHTPPRPVQRPHPPIIVGGTGPKRTPADRGPVRRRVQRRPQRRPARELRALRPGLRADRPRPDRGPPLGRAAGGLRRRPRPR